MTAPYTLIPPTHNWQEDALLLATHLLAAADASRAERAALSLLYRDPGMVWYRLGLTYLTTEGDHLDWALVSTRAEHRLIVAPPLTARERALLLLACSMASRHCPVRLGEVLLDLDQADHVAFRDAVRYWAARR